MCNIKILDQYLKLKGLERVLEDIYRYENLSVSMWIIKVMVKLYS